MERAIQRTDGDALDSKLAAVSKGYYSDAYLSDLEVHPPRPRLPLINIGTYCRVIAIDRLVEQFLNATRDAPRRAIISLGAGSDSRPFNVLSKRPANLVYHEMDFPVMIQRKQRKIMSSANIREAIGLEETSSYADTATYRLHGVDLRYISDYKGFGLQSDEPILLLSECCLCYLKPKDSQNVLQTFKSYSKLLSVVLYEPIGRGDAFGSVMAENLAQRGLSLPSFELWSTEKAQIKRLLDLGLNQPDAVSLDVVYNDWISVEERARIRKIELLDEVEEMLLLLNHYCIAWSLPLTS